MGDESETTSKSTQLCSSLQILLELIEAVVDRNPSPRKKTLEIKLWNLGKLRRLAQCKPFLLKQGNSQFRF